MLAELLRDPAAAVSCLPSGTASARPQAAELAESAKLAPGGRPPVARRRPPRPGAVAFARLHAPSFGIVAGCRSSRPASPRSASPPAPRAELPRHVRRPRARRRDRGPPRTPARSPSPWVDASLPATVSRLRSACSRASSRSAPSAPTTSSRRSTRSRPTLARRRATSATFAESLLSLPAGARPAAAPPPAPSSPGPRGTSPPATARQEKLAAFANAPTRPRRPACVGRARPPTLSARVNATVHTVSPEDGVGTWWDGAASPTGARASRWAGRAGCSRVTAVLARLDAPAVGPRRPDHGDRCLGGGAARARPRGPGSTSRASARPWATAPRRLGRHLRRRGVVRGLGRRGAPVDRPARRAAPRAPADARLPRGMTVGMHQAPTMLAFPRGEVARGVGLQAAEMDAARATGSDRRHELPRASTPPARCGRLCGPRRELS